MEGKYFVDTVSRYIIDYCDKHFGGVSNYRLQKLLYFVQVEFIKETGQAAFKEEIEAWSFGPVVPEIYRKYKIFGGENIILNNNINVFSVLSSLRDIYNEKISKHDGQIINRVLDEASHLPTAELVRISHIQEPWKNAYNKDNPKNVITKESIYEYFVGV